MGADYLEQDIVATSDDELVVLHDIHLDRVSDVARLFPGRARADGRYYVRDFTLPEIRKLKVNERVNADGSPVYPGRFSSADEEFRIHTFAEELQFTADMEAAAGRPVGVYPEIKRPRWHQQQGFDITPAVLGVLKEFNYTSHDAPAYLQCFDAQELRRIRGPLGCELKLVQLIADNAWQEAPGNFDALRSTRGLQRLAKTVDGIGPWIPQLYRYRKNDDSARDSGLVGRAHAAGLCVHPYTARSDDLPVGFATMTELFDFLIDDLNVDGLFTDFPDAAAAYLRGDAQDANSSQIPDS